MTPMLIALAVALVAACVVLSVFSGDSQDPVEPDETGLADLLDP